VLQARVQGLETEVQDLRKQLQAMQLDRTNQQAQLDQLSRVALRGVAVEPPPPPAEKTVGPIQIVLLLMLRGHMKMPLVRNRSRRRTCSGPDPESRS